MTLPEFPDMEALAAKYGVSIQSIKAHSASKKPTWAARRAIRLAECQARVESNVLLRDAREARKLKTADTSIAERLNKTAVKLLDSADAKLTIVVDAAGGPSASGVAPDPTGASWLALRASERGAGSWLFAAVSLLLLVAVAEGEPNQAALATASEQPQPPAAQAESPEDDPPLSLPGWLADLLGQTPPEPQTFRLPGWIPRILGAQATVIDQGVLPFHSPYRNANSFKANGDNQISQTYGLYLGSKLTTHLQLYFDVEMFKGAGIGNATGLGGLTDGDVIRSGSVQLGQDPYTARAYLRYLFPLSAETAQAERAMDQLPGTEPIQRVELKFGRFAANDDFDQNRYANSTRTQFLNWSLWNNTAWDFAADTRGFSYGVLAAWVNPTWTVRVGSLMMPTVANGNTMDDQVWRARGDNVEFTRSRSDDCERR